MLHCFKANEWPFYNTHICKVCSWELGINFASNFDVGSDLFPSAYFLAFISSRAFCKWHTYTFMCFLFCETMWASLSTQPQHTKTQQERKQKKKQPNGLITCLTISISSFPSLSLPPIASIHIHEQFDLCTKLPFFRLLLRTPWNPKRSTGKSNRR